MSIKSASDFSNLIYPFYGEDTGDERIMNTSIQTFSNKVVTVSSLNTGGRISSEEAYQAIKQEYKRLKRVRRSIK